jgi:hypothetical protein
MSGLRKRSEGRCPSAVSANAHRVGASWRREVKLIRHRAESGDLSAEG